VELATALNITKSGGLILAAITYVFTIGYVANQLGEDEDWLFELSGNMFPKTAASGSTASARTAFPLHQRRHRQPAPDHRQQTRRWPRTTAG
jgi:hypothetical protein